jgi:hypothetical protein
MKVAIQETKSGKEKMVEPRFAKILVGLGKHTYMTRGMAAAPAQVVHTKPADDLLGEPNADLDKMDLPALHALALSYELKLHPQTGEKKVRAAIIAHRAKAK